MSVSESSQSPQGIAIVGMAGRFPGAKNLEEFWCNLRDGVESISFFSDDELASVEKGLLKDPNYVKANGLLSDIDLFDANFFGFSPREAEIIDPQQRLFLECAWEALENAGYDSQQYQGRISIYSGSSVSTYLLSNLWTNSDLIELVGLDQIRHSNRLDNLATRVAYKLNLQGAAVTVQTGCSTSLVAVHLACQSLLDYESDLALAGGVAINATQKAGYLYQNGGILSPDGHCRAFDAKAQGTVLGNGLGIVVLKRLADALEAGDCIHAIIRGSAINNDGSLKAGYTAPSVNGQAQVITEALALAQVEAETISYVETHGTGTVLGDPIEIAGLTEAFRATTDKTGFCKIGSLKSNIGHLDTAAGVAGLIKTVLALKQGQIPPSLHFEQPNPQINFAKSPFRVNTTLTEWKTNGTPRRAGVSSFGIGGTNAHVILEEAPISAKQPTEEGKNSHLLVLSAKTPNALETATTNLVAHLKQHPHLNLTDVAYTLQVGRRSFDYRRMVVCQTLEEAANALLERQQVLTGVAKSHRSLVFMFPGQGSQYVEMGEELYQTEAVFREYIDRCSVWLQSHLALEDMRSLLYPSPEQQPAASERIKQTSITQLALFITEYALAQLWLSWGIQPQIMIGHSIGEYVAATLAGVFSLEDALLLVALRGKLMQQLPTGAMLAVPLCAEEIKPLLGETLALAASNSPNLCVVSGSESAIERLSECLAQRNVTGRRLHTSHGFHSQMMDSIIEPFTLAVSQVKLNSPSIPFISNVTGTQITAEEATDPHYWAKHLRQTVRFSEGIKELLQLSDPILLEVGPGRTLSTLAKQHLDSTTQATILTSLRHPNDSIADVPFLLNTLGKLWLAGLEIDWSRVHSQEHRQRLPLPTYPFERQRYWIEPQSKTLQTTSRLRKQPNLADWFYIPIWKQSPLLEISIEEKLSQSYCWLVFEDECGLGSQLKKRLQNNGQDIITVQIGEKFSSIGDGVYQINPQQKEDYETLLGILIAQGKIPQQILHLWNLTPNAQTFSELEQWETEQFRSFWSLVFLTQALGEQTLQQVQSIFVITNHLHSVIGDETLSATKATLLGPCRVIPQEYPSITCRNIDLILPNGSIEPLINRLVAELTSPVKDPIVAYRGQHRWIQDFEAIPLEDKKAKKPLRSQGVYLITGGLGGIGLTLATYLAQTVQAKLVLMGRSPIAELPNHKLEQIREIEALGAQVMISSADVTNLEQMQALKEQVLEGFGAIHGIIHCAGIPGGGMIALKTPSEANQVLAPKVKGTLVLERVFEDTPLDFLVLCSALTSILGRLGQVDYCAANAFLDAIAHRNSSQEKPLTLAINWSAWQQVGMAVNTAIPEAFKQERSAYLKEAITPEEGMIAFSRLLGTELPQIVVSTRDLKTQIEQNKDVQILTSGTTHARPDLGDSYIAPRTEIERILAEIWQQLLGIEQIGIHDNFFELGGHSLLLTQLVNRLHKTFQIDLAMRTLFEYPTIAKLAQLISEQSTIAATATEEKSIKVVLQEALGRERLLLLENYLRQKIARTLNLEQIPPDGNLAQFDLGANVAALIWDIKQDLKLPIYPHEILRRPSIKELAEFILNELDHISGKFPESPYSYSANRLIEEILDYTVNSPNTCLLKPFKKNRPMVFLHSSPRSGSTLLRIMLAGHPMLFCPPELTLLTMESMQQRYQPMQGFDWGFQGLQSAVIDLFNINQSESQELIQTWVDQDLPIHKIYHLLQEAAGDRLLVDKTPNYAISPKILERGEEIFENPKYIHLVRHPYSVIESYVRHRLYANLPLERVTVDPYRLAEAIWVKTNRHLLNLGKSVGSQRYHLVYYEELVSNPERVMRDLCKFLEIPFDEALLHPYDGKRTIGGLGDPDILQHEQIEANLGEVWKTIHLPRPLADEAKELVTQLNYELPSQYLPLFSSTWEAEQHLLSQLDRLSDQEVQTLLYQLLTEEKMAK